MAPSKKKTTRKAPKKKQAPPPPKEVTSPPPKERPMTRSSPRIMVQKEKAIKQLGKKKAPPKSPPTTDASPDDDSDPPPPESNNEVPPIESDEFNNADESDEEEETPQKLPPKKPVEKTKSTRTTGTSSNNSSGNVTVSSTNPKKNKSSKATSKTASKGSGKATGSSKNRSVNYNSPEDLVLASAWLKATENSRKGTDRKSEQFWEDVHKYYVEKCDKDGLSGHYPERDTDSLKNRFDRVIKKQVKQFAARYSHSKSIYRSGWTEKHYIDDALANYRSMFGTPFSSLMGCWNILRNNPTFASSAVPTAAAASAAADFMAKANEFIVEDDDDYGDGVDDSKPAASSSKKRLVSSVQSNKAGVAAGRMGIDSSNLPDGTKRTKKSASDALVETSLLSHISEISTSQKQMAQYIGRQSEMEDASESYRRDESFVKMLFHAGLMDEARKTLLRMHGERESQCRSSSVVQPSVGALVASPIALLNFNTETTTIDTATTDPVVEVIANPVVPEVEGIIVHADDSADVDDEQVPGTPPTRAEPNDPTKCVDCQEIASNHVCLECGVVVCSMCCDKYSDLQGVWCCRSCFNHHSPTTRELIRKDKYSTH